MLRSLRTFSATPRPPRDSDAAPTLRAPCPRVPAGTRLRPLTLTKPKPLVEFCNMPILEHQVKALVEVGVRKIVLAVSYQPETMMEALKGFEERYGIKLIVSVEREPLGTGEWGWGVERAAGGGRGTAGGRRGCKWRLWHGLWWRHGRIAVVVRCLTRCASPLAPQLVRCHWPASTLLTAQASRSLSSTRT